MEQRRWENKAAHLFTHIRNVRRRADNAVYPCVVSFSLMIILSSWNYCCFNRKHYIQLRLNTDLHFLQRTLKIYIKNNLSSRQKHVQLVFEDLLRNMKEKWMLGLEILTREGRNEVHSTCCLIALHIMLKATTIAFLDIVFYFMTNLLRNEMKWKCEAQIHFLLWQFQH